MILYTCTCTCIHTKLGGIHTKLGVARLMCLRGGGGCMTERVITVGIGQFLLVSATSGFSSYIKLAYCSSAQ